MRRFSTPNVLVYAAAGGGEDGEETAKRQHAMQLIEEEDFGLSAQVLQEFFVTVVLPQTLVSAQRNLGGRSFVPEVWMSPAQISQTNGGSDERALRLAADR